MIIRKTSETRPLAGNIVNAYSESQNSTYSCEFTNGDVLYSSSEKIYTAITLNEDVSNYRYLEIFYNNYSSNSGVMTAKIDVATALTDNFILMAVAFSSSDTTFYVDGTKYSLSGTLITPTAYRHFRTDEGTTATNRINIFKVIGYK